jgi:hypothetical protein
MSTAQKLFIKSRRKTLGFSHRDIRRVPFVGLGHRGAVAIDQMFYLCDTRTIHEMSRAGISDEETIDAGFAKTQEELSLMKSYKFRLYPTKKQVEILQWTLDRCRALYNAALQERRDAYDRGVRQHPNYYDEDARKELSKKHAVGYNE